jgi:hypothetical protein
MIVPDKKSEETITKKRVNKANRKKKEGLNEDAKTTVKSKK